MKYMVCWTIRTEHYQAAAADFLASGAPAPEGLTMHGRWHVPGSRRGFALVEGDDAAVVQHAADWGHLLEIEMLPVVDDETAATGIARSRAAP